MKKDQYFNLEVNLLNDDNIASMMSEMNAAEALGIYVILLFIYALKMLMRRRANRFY